MTQKAKLLTIRKAAKLRWIVLYTVLSILFFVLSLAYLYYIANNVTFSACLSLAEGILGDLSKLSGLLGILW